MTYKVRADSIAQDISDDVKNAILEFLPSYDFPYVTSVTNKVALKQVFTEHFEKRTSFDWLKKQIYRLTNNRRGVAAVAWCETNRLHTKALGNILLAQGRTKCKTIHSYGDTTPMSLECRNNLEGKTLDIREVITNSFPENIDGLNKKAIPMIPQHFNCRHIMAPLE
ncbi:hypothetical protein ACFLVH_02450 [Chloroflexota bacterium]